MPRADDAYAAMRCRAPHHFAARHDAAFAALRAVVLRYAAMRLF